MGKDKIFQIKGKKRVEMLYMCGLVTGRVCSYWMWPLVINSWV